MGGIVRPFARLLAGTGAQVPAFSAGGQLQIDWKSPLANGLIGAYLPGLCYGDFTSNNGQLTTVGAFGIPVATPEGHGIGVASTQAGTALTSTAGNLAAGVGKWVTNGSCFMRFQQVANTVGGASEPLLFVTDGGNVSFVIAEATGTGNTNVYAFAWGGFTFTANGAAVSNAMHDFTLTMQINPLTSTLWLDGVSYLTSTLASAPVNVLANSKIEVGGLKDNVITALYFYNKVLTVNDAIALHNDPYGIFQPLISSVFPLAGDPRYHIDQPEAMLPTEIWL